MSFCSNFLPIGVRALCFSPSEKDCSRNDICCFLCTISMYKLPVLNLQGTLRSRPTLVSRVSFVLHFYEDSGQMTAKRPSFESSCRLNFIRRGCQRSWPCLKTLLSSRVRSFISSNATQAELRSVLSSALYSGQAIENWLMPSHWGSVAILASLPGLPAMHTEPSGGQAATQAPAEYREAIQEAGTT